MAPFSKLYRRFLNLHTLHVFGYLIRPNKGCNSNQCNQNEYQFSHQYPPKIYPQL